MQFLKRTIGIINQSKRFHITARENLNTGPRASHFLSIVGIGCSIELPLCDLHCAVCCVDAAHLSSSQ